MTGPADRRIGRFSISADLINEDPELAREMLAGIIVIRAEFSFFTGGICYEGISDAFAVAAASEMPPSYMPLLEKRGGDVHFKEWARLSP